MKPPTGKPTETPVARFDLGSTDGARLREAVEQIPIPPEEDDTPAPLIELTGLAGQHAACMRWSHPLRIRGEGRLGDYAFAWNAGSDFHLVGSAGDGVGEGMIAGVIRVRSNVGCGAGTAMTGGTLAIYGSAGPRCGAAMRGGSVFVRGDVGEDTGAGALGGTIVVGGNAGPRLGDAQNNVTVFLRGSAESLAPGVTEAPLRKREQLRLGLLLMGASIRGSVEDFRRIVPIAKLIAEEAGEGEVRPNWR